ncbi:MAG: RNA 2',3'-cyclic phosphodiesterase [Rhodospirillaceae bacterium]|jgi:2'-5' RNA ligase|nr:RNA 2',3'-cyclic phosphodiesterase [Rhodospirillaceae bacterium]MBT3909729.1 RNA 2',3'-cyclic phosphodiesterase [Rhodospirillaceae bacterium]MBT5296910.1 RNA 2',3'-cyclic phosphodiesterase [Rhodospirillaceae bacterium]MBT5513795.1 RNA 2',3'-cyclic phosphodiesterase [Rhodospirillaceae bacterium]MBT6085527.1 RNA 2',3'-cyclic phosphodiesterase [Rhodospirillaceae bacterium]
MRLFVGLSLPAEIRACLRGMCNGLEGARWVQTDNMHMTLRFIGEVDGGEAQDLDAALGAISASEFGLELRGLGHFGKGAKVRAVWVDVAPAPNLTRLHENIEGAIVRAGIEPEHRKFRPHVTLARFKGRGPKSIGAYLEANNTFAAPTFPITAFTLFESHMGHGGSHYVALKDYPLSEV